MATTHIPVCCRDIAGGFLLIKDPLFKDSVSEPKAFITFKTSRINACLWCNHRIATSIMRACGDSASKKGIMKRLAEKMNLSEEEERSNILTKHMRCDGCRAAAYTLWVRDQIMHACGYMGKKPVIHASWLLTDTMFSFAKMPKIFTKTPFLTP